MVVLLEQGRPENLTCNRSSGKYEIQWLKVKLVKTAFKEKEENIDMIDDEESYD